MNVDLLSALEARAAEEPARESAASENEFPNVLRASMDRDEAAEARGQETRSQDESNSEPRGNRDQEPREIPSETELGPATTAVTESQPGEELAPEPASADVEAEDQSSIEAASLGGALAGAGAVADRVRTSTDISSVVPVEGRLSELEADAPGQAKPGPSSEQPVPTEAGGTFSRPLADSEAELAHRAIETARDQEQSASRAPAADPSSSAGVSEALVVDSEEPAAARVAETPLRRESSVPVERTPGEAAIAETREAAQVVTGETSSEQRQDEPRDQEASSSAREDSENAPRLADQTEFDRAQAGAQSAGVDPNLRQALATREDARNAPDAIAVSGGALVANPIAGSVTEMTPAAPAGSAPAAASEAISVQTEWLATRGGGTARLVLHPQELGEVSIRVTLRGASVEVVMVAQEAAAQSIAEDQADRLFQALASRDLRMDQFEVRRGEPGDLPQAGADRFAESGGGQERSGHGPGQEDSSAADRGATGGLAGRGAGAPEIPPRIVSLSETAAGVDLRI